MSATAKASKKHKKLIKVGKSVANEFGVKLSSEPTKVRGERNSWWLSRSTIVSTIYWLYHNDSKIHQFVLLSNAGLVNGGLTSSILKILPEWENIQYDIVLFPSKTYAVVRCPDVDTASAVVESVDESTSLDFLHGQQVHAGFLDGGTYEAPPGSRKIL